MAESENQTLRLLRELREQEAESKTELVSLRKEMRDGFDNVNERLKNLQRKRPRPLHGRRDRGAPGQS